VLILLTYPHDDIAAAASSGNIVYRPDLAAAPADAVAQALESRKPDVLVTRYEVPPAVLAAWRTARPDAPLLVVHVGVGEAAGEATCSGQREDGVGHFRITHRRADDTVAALRIAERIWNEALSTAPPVRASTDRSVTLVGGGIVNLITALHLVRHGYEVTLYDRTPDPRGNAHWTAYGCTRGGGDGRMFTLTEADSYNSRAWRPDGTSNDLLGRSISDHGWLVSKPGDLLERERRWAEEFQRIPSWLADSYNDDIFAVNKAARGRWAGLIESDPKLFDDSTGYRQGILRLYTEVDYFRWHISRNDRVGAIRQVLTPRRVRAEYPALDDACTAGTIVGGIEVLGFTVNVHKFVGQLVTMLELEGVQFHWDAPVTRIHWAESGIVEAIETVRGAVRSQHYVLSPGAYGDELLQGTSSYGQIQGMLGVWLTVPNIEPRLENSVKIAREGHRAEETNVTLATDQFGAPILVCGSGYGWTGLNPHNIDSAELDVLFEALEDTLRQFFPKAHTAARVAGTLDTGKQLCVRPWTASCLGVFERVETAGGGMLIVTGGHNTGGFAQSPVVAEAVLAAFEGREHPMHTRYDPRRLERFYGDATPEDLPPV
jgi:glycine/D-amino acid oxidase-like deaminating enzyme